MTSTSLRAPAWVLLASTLAGTLACARPAVEPPGPMVRPDIVRVTDTVRVVDTVRVETPSEVDPELEDQIAHLQIQLLERDALVEDLEAQLDATRREVVRNMGRLQGQTSRAEAASGIAEAEIEVETLGRMSGGRESVEYGRAGRHLQESGVAFGSENYGGALYLATQARRTAAAGQGRYGSDEGLSPRSGETLFALPIPLQTVSRSNLRAGPGMKFEVLFTVDGGADLTGRSHTHQWLRVAVADGREGWIFHTLVTAPHRER